MRVAHILRKLDPAEWSGTETAIQRLLIGLRACDAKPVVYCPKLENVDATDPLVESGFEVHRVRAFVPVLGLSEQRRRQLVSVGGNLMSFQLVRELFRDRDLSVMHSHTLGRFGGIALTVAKRRRLPFIVTIHGGVMDLPEPIKASFNKPVSDGWEWGRLLGVVFQSRRLFVDADAILTCNSKEAKLLQERFPDKRVVVQPHGVPTHLYRVDCREQAAQAFPQICGRTVVLCLGRIDPIKNQTWLLDQAPQILRSHPDALLVLAGPCTDEPYGEVVRKRIEALGLENRVLLTGGLPPDDPRTIGLLQSCGALVLPSLSETFGLVILEAWAAGAPVLSARASGPTALIKDGVNGWLFDLDDSVTFQQALSRTLNNPELGRSLGREGGKVSEQYSVNALAARLKQLYSETIQAKRCAT